MTRLISLVLLTLAIGCNDPAPSISTTDGGTDSGMDAGMDSTVVVNNCESNPCQNGGSCFDNGTTFVCTCVAGFSGTMCETNVDECAVAPCQNGGTCMDGVNSFTCDCTGTGFDGATCEADINECAVTVNGGCGDAMFTNCVNTPGSFNCVDIDECATNHGGCDPLVTCTNQNGMAPTCGACPSGYTGDGLNGCVDINECNTNNGGCGNFACTNTNGSFTCETTCILDINGNPAFKGTSCTVPPNAMYLCFANPVPNGATVWNNVDPTTTVLSATLMPVVGNGTVTINFGGTMNIPCTIDYTLMQDGTVNAVTSVGNVTRTLYPYYAAAMDYSVVAANNQVTVTESSFYAFCVPLGF